MATVVLTGVRTDTTSGKRISYTQTTTATALNRVIYATVGGTLRTFERVGTDAAGNAVYRDQTRSG